MRWLPLLFLFGASNLAAFDLPHASAWPDADRLFRGDSRWVGGDGAYSVDLGQGRVLWLFGDSLIDASGRGSRHNSTMIANSLAIQTGYDPSAADIRFFWGSQESGAPAAFFGNEEGERYWPGHGIRLGNTLTILLMRVHNTGEGLGFDVDDWAAVRIANPDDGPSEWRWAWLDTPPAEHQIIIGSSSLLAQGDHVYAFSAREPGPLGAYLVRWPRDRFLAGVLKPMAWWDGSNWVASAPVGEPILPGAPTEFTVHHDPARSRFVQVQSQGFGSAVIQYQEAESLLGPWPGGRTIYEPPESRRPGAMIYQGKAHPHLRGADLVLTYCTNAGNFDQVLDGKDLYYPRFIRITEG